MSTYDTQRNRRRDRQQPAPEGPPDWFTPPQQLRWWQRRGATILDPLGGPVSYAPRRQHDTMPWVSQSGAFRYKSAQCRIRPPR